MDVHCSSCGEPWDTYHLRHDAIFETNLDPSETEAWTDLPSEQKLSGRYRAEFKTAGYEFGASVLDVLRCPACPKGSEPNVDKAALKAGLVEILGEDDDAIASTFNELRL